MNIKKIIISPPFGPYLRFKNCSCVYGSYTLNERKGLVKQIIKTLRFTSKGVLNRMGLRNKGIYNLNKNHTAKDIVSVAFLKENDDIEILNALLKLKQQKILKTNNIELNFSCPNAKLFNAKQSVIKEYVKHFNIIAKMQPQLSIESYKNLIELGVNVFHVSNTLPTLKGALSGKTLKPLNIKTIKELKTNFNEVKVIAGGGITCYNDIKHYKECGACYFSISSVLFNPFKSFLLFTQLLKKPL